MLPDFEVRNFRGFRHLLLPKLGRINLIVGKNNVGKSSLLEAVRIYASNGLPEVLWEAVTSRDEHRQARKAAQAFSALFHESSDVHEAIELGPRNDKLLLSLQFRRESRSEDGTVQYTLLENLDDEELVQARVDLIVKSESSQRSLPLGRDFELYLRREPLYRREQLRAEMQPRLRAVFVAANGLSRERQAELWDDVALSALEEDVISSLRLIVPNLERVSLIGSKDDRGRFPFVKLSQQDSPIPLRRLGDGVNRVFGMALALVNSQGGVLLIDEIENGIHYSVQQNLWEFILRVSRRLNVQVFATSHSWDCLRAFESVASTCDTEEGILTRLEFTGGTIRASQFEEPELDIAAKEHIEIR